MISLQNVYKAFGSNQVLNGFSLDVREGETVVIIGYSGTGKSVAIKHIVGLLEPDKGTVFVDDLEVPKLKRRALYELRSHIGYVFQFAALFDSLSVNENVAMGLVKAGTFTPKEIAVRVQEALELVDLPEAGNTSPIELSGGMRKRVGLARAIIYEPQIVLYDEPTTGLDPIVSDSIDKLIIRVRDHLKVTSVVVTHDMRSARRVGNHVLMLHNKKIYANCTPESLFASHDPVVRQFIDGVADPREVEF
jgi:phospholipid/cholesterol/gamma-HCH transport system ATP-binding protein